MSIPFYLGFESSKGRRGSDLLWTVVFSFYFENERCPTQMNDQALGQECS